MSEGLCESHAQTQSLLEKHLKENIRPCVITHNIFILFSTSGSWEAVLRLQYLVYVPSLTWLSILHGLGRKH